MRIIILVLLISSAARGQTVNVIPEDKTIVVDGRGVVAAGFPSFDTNWRALHWKDGSGVAELKSGGDTPITTATIQPFLAAHAAEIAKVGVPIPPTPAALRRQLYQARALLDVMNAELLLDPLNADIKADRDAQAVIVIALRAAIK